MSLSSETVYLCFQLRDLRYFFAEQSPASPSDVMLANAAMSMGDSGPAAQCLTCAKSLFCDLDTIVVGLGLVLGGFQAQLSWTLELLCVTAVHPGPA